LNVTYNICFNVLVGIHREKVNRPTIVGSNRNK
jgi:hypothetical protein